MIDGKIIRKILQNKNFLKLWLSQIFSQLTIYITNFIFINRIYRITRSPLAVSFLWLFYVLPSILLAPIVGFLVDLWDKRKILFITNCLQALTIASYFFIRGFSYHFIYILVFSYSFLNQFYLPAESTSIPWLVKKEFLPIVNSLFLLTSQFSFVIGFGLGGILTKLFNENLTIIFTSLMLFAAALAVSLLPKEKRRKKQAINISKMITKEIKAGWNFVLRKKLLVLYALGLMSLFQVITVTASLLLPAIIEQIVQMNFIDAAPILVFSLGLGLILGSLTYARFNNEQRKKQWIINGIAVLGLSIGSLPLAISLPGIARLIMVILALFVGGLACVFIIIPAQTFIQEVTPDRLRGRVFGILTAFVTLAAILPTLLVASLIELLGVIKFIWLIAVSLLSLSIYISKNGDQIIVATSNRA